MKIKLVGKPKHASYLTPGKEYELIRPSSMGGGKTGAIVDDEGEEIGVLVGCDYPCPHARPAKWEIVE